MKRDAINFDTENVSALFRKLLIPTLFGAISVSCVTAIDGIFVGHGVGAEGVAAVNFFVPVYQIIAGLGLMIGAGCSVVSSIHLSRKNLKAARLNITQAFVVASVFTLLFCALMLCFPYQTAKILGVSETLTPLVVDYLMWLTPSYVFELWMLIGLFIIRLDGSPRFAMWCNIAPAALNVLFDWLFIFPLDMGVKGAAIATSLCHLSGGCLVMGYLLWKAETLRFVRLKLSKKSLMLTARNIGYQIKVGSSSLFGELTLAVLIYVGNITFLEYLGDEGVGAFGVACYYTPFFFMIGNSIAQSAQPIISYNYGISRWEQVRKVRSLLLYTSFVLGLIVSLMFVGIPDILVALFVDINGRAGQIAVEGFPLYASGIIFFILNVAIVGYYQSVEQIRKATIFVFLRGLVLLVPSFIILPKMFGVSGIWLAMAAAEFATLVLIWLTSIVARIRSRRQTV